MLTHGFQHPAYGTVPSAAGHLEVGHVLEHTQASHGTLSGAQYVHLSRIQDVLELPQHPRTLSPSGLGIDEYQQGHRGGGSGDLEGHGRLLG